MKRIACACAVVAAAGVVVASGKAQARAAIGAATITCDDRVCGSMRLPDARPRYRPVQVARVRARVQHVRGSTRGYGRYRDPPSPTMRVVDQGIPLPRPRPPAMPTSRDSGVGRVDTAAGPITISLAHAAAFVGFINDLVASGYTPKTIGCYASGGHIRGSLHYSGEACDIDQVARNRAPGRMYTVGALAAKWGLRDGCVFHDCGHIDTGHDRFAAVVRRARTFHIARPSGQRWRGAYARASFW